MNDIRDDVEIIWRIPREKITPKVQRLIDSIKKGATNRHDALKGLAEQFHSTGDYNDLRAEDKIV